ncbi:hypothetical protein J8I29_01060 [Labrys sp. LIt4]|uniref:hypothetical protein n=1 Tax=Labrys sp. LIt4 TaxID=2821355 RepID=UPI001AE0084B|nr:hypothetical protein [Labrys sp. LIt4]MBP0577887.1 hypothetical protein [Labrys sp. LIt4]
MSDPSDPLESGDGSVVTPLLTKFRGLTSPGHRQFAVAEFEFADGAIIRIPIACDAVASFNDALVVWMSKGNATSAVVH